MDSTTSNTASKPFVILFVGSNPSNASVIDIAFHTSTQSSRVLTDWCVGLQGMKVHINVQNTPTEDNRPLKASEIATNTARLAQDIASMKPDRVIALGKTAAKALSMIEVAHYEMPHPSGRNRLLNDPDYVAGKVKGLLEYCSNRPQTKSN